MFTQSSRRYLILFALIPALLVGCSSVRHPSNPDDPYEGYNRKVFKFNRGVDKVVYRPVAKVYTTVTPKFAQKGVSNFFSNLDDLTVVANDVLQANPSWMFSDTGRLLVNSTIGVGGLFDVAKHWGMPKHKQDFGLTMAKWGVRRSPYLLIPFMGIGTARDQFAFLVNYQFLTVYPYLRPDWLRYSLYGMSLIDLRAAYLPTDELVNEAFDPYIFVRDAYLQSRNLQIQKVLHPRENLQNPTPTSPKAFENANSAF